MQSRRPSMYIEGLNSSLTQSAGKLQSCKVMVINTLRAGVRYIRTLISTQNQQFQLPYQHPSSSADCARELFNGSNGSASLVD